jgi:copper chaperone
MLRSPTDSAAAQGRTSDELAFLVTGMSCGHCQVAVTAGVSNLAGVASVEVDLDSKLVRVNGTDLDGEAVLAAIDEAGYDAVPA